MAPVGSYESLMAAIAAGADSVYFGVGQLNMRSRSAANFTLDDLARIVAIARQHGLKTYLTVNTILYDEEIATMHEVIDRAKREGVDAVIVADQSAILYARSVGMEVHISTQLNVSNTETLRFYARWADVVVLARELNLDQIARIYDNITREPICGPNGRPVKNVLRDRDTGEEIATEGRYLLSPKDLCTIPFLDRFIGAGVRVLKIEGRARSAEYVKRVVETYDEAVRAVVEGTFSAEKADRWVERLSEVFNRGFWAGYYQGAPVVELSAHYGSSATVRKVYVGKITNFFKKIGVAEVQVEASPLERGASYVILGETTGALEGTVEEVYVDDRPADVAPQGVFCSIRTPQPVRRGDKLYKIVPAEQTVTQD